MVVGVVVVVVGVVVVVVDVVVVVVGVVVTVVGPTVIAAFRGVLFVFTVANLAIGVALAPRYAASPPDAIYGNNLAQQITSTFDVVICALSLAVLVAMLFTGPLAAYLGSPPRSAHRSSTRAGAVGTTDDRATSATLANAENCSA